MSLNNSEFDFDVWAALAKANPEAFEAKRREVIEQFIADVPPQRQARMRGLQWRVDIERAQYRHPLASCAHLFNMMWSSVYGEAGLVDALNGKAEPVATSAAVLPFVTANSQKPGEVAASS